MRPLVIVGAGGFGREVFSIVSALVDDGADWEVVGFADDRPGDDDCRRVAELGSRILGSVADVGARDARFAAVVAVGSPIARAAISAVLEGSPVEFPVLVHPDATVGAGVRLGAGTVVAPGARLSTNITVGQHVHIDQNATVGHDCELGDFARLNPQACLSGSVYLGPGATVGAHATVLQNISVGRDALIGAGAVVTRDVHAGAIVKGVPAK